jgi:magnesium transporter
LGRKTLLSVHDCREDIFGPARRRLESEGSLLRCNDASFLCYSLLDSLVDQSFPILEELSERLEELETQVLLTKPSRRFGDEIYHLRRELMVMRRTAWPMRDLVNQLCRDRHECLSAATQLFFRDMYDHVMQISEYVETYREVANSLAEMHMSAMSNRMNQVMKTLTIVSTIFVPLTFLAGVYGMNMPIPENEHAISYPIFWIVSVCCALGMLLAFRLRDWI